MAFISYLIVICLARLYFFMFLGSALDVHLNMKIVIFPNFNKIPEHVNSGNSVRFESFVLQTNVRTEDGLIVDFRNSLRTRLEAHSVLKKNSE